MADVLGGLQNQITNALALRPGGDNALREGIAALGRVLERLIEQISTFSVDPANLLLEPSDGEPARVDPLLALLRILGQTSIDNHELLRQLDRQLGEAWADLEVCYEAHKARQGGFLRDHLEQEEFEDWLEDSFEGASTTLDGLVKADGNYPADEVETALRFRNAVCHLVGGLRATLREQDHEGWIHFELSLLLLDEFKRRHIQEMSWDTQELEAAGSRGDTSEMVLWTETQRQREVRFQRWWQLYGPVYSWLTERLEMCPSGLDKIFDRLGEDLWELPMPDLLDRARDILV